MEKQHYTSLGLGIRIIHARNNDNRLRRLAAVVRQSDTQTYRRIDKLPNDRSIYLRSRFPRTNRAAEYVLAVSCKINKGKPGFISFSEY